MDYLLRLVAASCLETMEPCISFEMQGFFFGVILGKMVGLSLLKEVIFMQFNDEVIAFIGYTVLALYYFIHVLKH